MKKFLLIDGNSIINRAFYGIRLLTNKNGIFTNGIYGFLNILFKNLDELSPDYVAVAFDLKAPTFRHKKYDGYKVQRKPMPKELAMQMPILKDVLSALNIAMYEKEGYEADDIIGTISRICDEENVECFIVTGDKDDLQLASKNTKILLTVTKGATNETTTYDDEKVFERYHVTPTQFIDVKALMGDSSDNIPGVAGIGEKTAMDLIEKYASLDGVYNNLESLTKSVKTKLENDKNMAYLSLDLSKIERFVPIDFSFDDNLYGDFDKKRVAEIFKNLEFNSFLKKLNVSNKEEVNLVVEKKEEAKIEVEGNLIYKIYENNGEIYAFSYLLKDKVCYFVNDMFLSGDFYGEIKRVFEDESILKISSDIKSDMVLLNQNNIMYNGKFFDTSVAGYVINPSRSGYEISDIAMEFLSLEVINLNEFLKSQKKTLNMLSDEEFSNALKEEINAIKLLYEFEKNDIEENNQHYLLYDIEFPLIKVLASMEIEGFLVDKQKLFEFSKYLSQNINELEEKIYNLAGEEFNILSPKQLGVILFDKLKLPAIKKTKTGYSTNAEVLEKLRGYNEIVDFILEYRMLTKLKSTYADGLLAVIASDGRIHSSFNQTVTVTGRISSTEPNLQNIPQRKELGREIRKMFVAKNSDYVLVDADYSQIELRILAHIADDKNMLEAFKNNVDIHTATAVNLFGANKDDVDPFLRSKAKAINFGIVYGKGEFSLAQDLNVTRKEAKEYIDGYFEKYQGIKNYMDTIVEKGKENGFVETIFGRRRYLPELKSSNFIARSQGERMAFNTPIQGSAADIIKIAMVKIYNALKENNLKSKLILQVHDELIIETHKDEVETVKKLLTECMESAAKLNVPLVAETGVGNTWYEAH
ncbi:MAG: DNA polymerase I [Ruminococcaceae bacterium]|nr:DNA polymerase I [Oscillospiraceae bacterium]